MKIYSKIKRAFHVEYRLAVLYRGDTKICNTYGCNLRLLRRMARKTNNALYWTIYKSGPLFIPERDIDSSS